MADLEKRVEVLECEMAIVKERTGRHDEKLVNVHKAQFAQSNADANIDADLQHERRMSEFRKLVADAVRQVFDERDKRQSKSNATQWKDR